MADNEERPRDAARAASLQVDEQLLRDLSTSLEGLVQMANWQVVLLKDAKNRLDEMAGAGPPSELRRGVFNG